MSTLADLIDETTRSELGLNKRLVLFGQADCDAAAKQVTDFVETKLNSKIVEVLLVAVASAGTFGLRLSDGRDVFLKIHAGEHTAESLRAIHDAQEEFRMRGIPVARRILALAEFGNGRFASVHAFRDRGELLRARHKGVIEAAARGLARLDSIAPQIENSGIPSFFETSRNPLYRRVSGGSAPPESASADHALGLLKEIGEKARTLQTPRIISHGDWAARNLRFWSGEVSSIFDFEALVSGPHAFLVGRSAIRFINEPMGIANPADAAARFIETYEESAGRAFENEDAEALDTGVTYGVARYLFSTVRSGHVRDEEAPDISRIFMRKFRTRFNRYIPEGGP